MEAYIFSLFNTNRNVEFIIAITINNDKPVPVIVKAIRQTSFTAGRVLAGFTYWLFA
jgi:hypothetical protein